MDNINVIFRAAVRPFHREVEGEIGPSSCFLRLPGDKAVD